MTSERKLTIAAVAAFFLVLAAYANHFQNDFHFDDWHTVTDNAYIRDLSNIPKFFTDAKTFSVLPGNQTYRPIVTLSLAIDYKLSGGLHPLWFHISSLYWFVVLLGAMYMLFLHIMDKCRPSPDNQWIALFAATLFGVHPACAETVNYIVQRGDIYSTLAVAAGLVLYIYWPAGRAYGGYLIPVVIGALAKPPALIFVPMLFVYLVMFDDGDVIQPGASRWGQAGRACIPAVIAAVAVGLFEGVMTPKTYTTGAASGYPYWITQPLVTLHYFKSFFLPTELTADTDRDFVSNIFSEGSVIGIAFLVLLGCMIRRTLRSKDWWPAAFGLIWFVIGVLPTAVTPLAEVENDHRMFLPFVGLTLAVAWTAARWAEAALAKWRASHAEDDWRPYGVLGALVAVILLAGAWGTRQRNAVWHSEESLWLDVTEKSPHNGRGLMNYGLTLMNKADYTGSLAYYRRAENYTPNYYVLKINEAIAYSAINDDANADRYFHDALSLAPEDWQPHFYYARWLNGKGRALEAINELAGAIQQNPEAPGPRSLLMEIYSEQGDAPRLKALAQETQRMFPSDKESAEYLASGPRGKAFPNAPAAPGAPPTKPATAEDYLALSLNLWREGRYAECVTAAQEAIKLKPDYAEAYNNVAAGYQSMGRWDDAIVAAKKAIALKPDFVLAKNNLAYEEAQKAAGAPAPKK